MLNTVSNGRQQAKKALIAQLVAVIAVSLLMLIVSPAHALATLIGGSSLTLGAAIAAWLALGGDLPAAAGLAMGRLMAGMAIKWLVLVIALVLALVVLKLPPLGLVLGVFTALVAQVIGMLKR